MKFWERTWAFNLYKTHLLLFMILILTSVEPAFREEMELQVVAAKTKSLI